MEMLKSMDAAVEATNVYGAGGPWNEQKHTHTYIAKDATVLGVSKWGGQRFDLAEDIE